MLGRGVQAELRRWAGMLLSGLSGLQLQGAADSASVDRSVTAEGCQREGSYPQELLAPMGSLR